MRNKKGRVSAPEDESSELSIPHDVIHTFNYSIMLLLHAGNLTTKFVMIILLIMSYDSNSVSAYCNIILAFYSDISYQVGYT